MDDARQPRRHRIAVRLDQTRGCPAARGCVCAVRVAVMKASFAAWGDAVHLRISARAPVAGKTRYARRIVASSLAKWIRFRVEKVMRSFAAPRVSFAIWTSVRRAMVRACQTGIVRTANIASGRRLSVYHARRGRPASTDLRSGHSRWTRSGAGRGTRAWCPRITKS